MSPGLWVHSAGSQARIGVFRPLPPDPLAWLLATFSTYFQNAQGQPVSLAAHHEDLWRWVWSLRAGETAPSFLAIWPRGGGKSASVELACACMGYYGLRRYGLYVSSNQSQADDHVSNVATMLEHLGVERQLNKYGFSRGWRVNRLRTSEGFTLDAVGMDAAMRGVRLDETRPDILCLDDLDEEHDSSATVDKKITTLTRKILPAGATSMAVLGVQNIPNTGGIFAQLVDGRAEFLLDRMISGPHPALRDVPEQGWYRLVLNADGPTRVEILAGMPTWAGQGIAECEALIAKIGVSAFLVECQHQTSRLLGTMFQRHWFPIVTDYPRGARSLRCWDLAGTEPSTQNADPDWTIGALIAYAQGQYWIVDVQRFRLSPKKVEDRIAQQAALDGTSVEILIEQEPGSSGKMVIEDFQRRVLTGYSVRGIPSTGSKLDRAKPAASAAEAKNIVLVEGPWITPFLETLCLFPNGKHDDDVDVLSMGVNYLGGQRTPGIYRL